MVGAGRGGGRSPDTARITPTTPTFVPGGGGARSRWWVQAIAVVILIGVLVSPTAVAAAWFRSE